MNKIHIINKRDNINTYEKFYIGRPSPLGNPYEIDNKNGITRTQVIREYRIYLREAIKASNPKICIELIRMREALQLGDIALECWCAPMMCHGEVIKEYLETGKV